MGVFCYADDLSLLCPSFTGIKEMLRTCEIYADEHKILFNAKKSQLLHFTKSSTSKDPQLFMNDGSIIPYGRFQMLHIITYYLSYIIAIQLT